MKPFGWMRNTSVIAAALLSWTALPADAQIAGVPVHYSLKHDPRWSVHFDYGNGARALDGLAYYGVRVSHALNSEAEAGPVRLSALAGFVDGPVGDATLALGASAGLALRMRRLVQFEAQLGAGFTNPPGPAPTRVDVPLGVAVGIVPSLPPLWFTSIVSRNPQFWLAPRVHMRWTESVGNLDGGLRGGVGLAGGMELRAQNGLGVQLIFERVAIRDPFAPRWSTEGAFGFGLFFAWI